VGGFSEVRAWMPKVPGRPSLFKAVDWMYQIVNEEGRYFLKLKDLFWTLFFR
jgi:hypothetical protein